jgi:hypothetical protein
MEQNSEEELRNINKGIIRKLKLDFNLSKDAPNPHKDTLIVQNTIHDF